MPDDLRRSSYEGTAALDLVDNRIFAGAEAWPFLGCRWTDPATGWLRILPGEFFRRLPRLRHSISEKDLTLNPIYWTLVSIMKESESDLDQRIAERVRELRAAQALSLDALAAKTGVSRSMISLIERGESSPTAVVLEKLAAGSRRDAGLAVRCPGRRDENTQRPGLRGVMTSRNGKTRHRATCGATSRRRACRSRCKLSRCISRPEGVWLSTPPCARCACSQQVWVLEGAMDITVGEKPPPLA